MQIRTPVGVSHGVTRGIRPPGYDKAHEAAIEKAKSDYIPLTCGHVTTWDDDQVYSHWRPSPKKHFCDKCGKWVLRLTKRKQDDLPATPLF